MEYTKLKSCSNISTADELVLEYAEDLSINSKSVTIARDLARKFDGFDDPSLNYTSQTIAASSLYIACLVCNQGIVQREIASVANVSKTSIQQGWHSIADRAGVDLSKADNRNRMDLDSEIQQDLESISHAIKQ